MSRFAKSARSSVVRSLVSFAAASCLTVVTTAAFADETTTDSAAAATPVEAIPAAEIKDEQIKDEATAPAVADEPKVEANADEAPVAKNAEKIPGKGSEEPKAEEPAAETAQPAAQTSSFRLELGQQNADKGGATKDKDAFRFGPMAGIGFPRPIAVEGFAKFQKVVGVGVEYSFLPTVTIAGAETNFKAIAADVRVFPFKNAFFVGLRGGRQWLSARAPVTAGAAGTSEETMNADAWFVNPRVGVLHTFKSGVTLGADIGVQLPINPTFARVGRAHDAGLTGDMDKTLASVANTLGNKTTITVDILRVGFMF